MANYPHFRPTEELHKELNTIRSGPVGYYVSTAGFVSQAQVKKYIDAQSRAMRKQSPIPPAGKPTGILGRY